MLCKSSWLWEFLAPRFLTLTYLINILIVFCFVFSYPDLKQLQSLQGHTANCICIKFDSTGKYFATGSADALVNLWDLSEMVVVRTFSRYFLLSLVTCALGHNSLFLLRQRVFTYRK